MQIKEDEDGCRKNLGNFVFLIANLAQLLAPFLPFSSSRVNQILGVNVNKWSVVYLPSIKMSGVKPLFQRIDIENIDIELEKLNSQVDDKE